MFQKVIFTILFSTAVLSGALQAQAKKREFEKSAKASELPDSLIILVNEVFPAAKNKRYYLESDGAQESYEIKLRDGGRKFSIEFYADGQLMDVEELVSFEELPEDLNEKIEDYFEEQFEKFVLTKVQKQFSGPNTKQVLEAIKLGETDHLNMRYEIEAKVEGEDEQHFGAYEFLFSAEGVLISTAQIVKRSSDNVTY